MVSGTLLLDEVCLDLRLQVLCLGVKVVVVTVGFLREDLGLVPFLRTLGVGKRNYLKYKLFSLMSNILA